MCWSPFENAACEFVLTSPAVTHIIFFDLVGWFVRWDIGSCTASFLWRVGSRICSKQHIAFLYNSHLVFLFFFFFSVPIVHPFGSTDTATGRKKSSCISSQISDFWIVGCDIMDVKTAHLEVDIWWVIINAKGSLFHERAQGNKGVNSSFFISGFSYWSILFRSIANKQFKYIDKCFIIINIKKILFNEVNKAILIRKVLFLCLMVYEPS